MLFSKTLKLLMCFVMIFPYLLYGSSQAEAAADYNHAELMEYEGYGESIYNSLVEQTTFITGQYTENKEYVSKSMDEIKDYAKFWWEENKIQGEGVGEKLKDMFTKGAGYALTVGDWVKNFFSDYEKTQPPEVDYGDYYSPYVYVDSGYLFAKPGYIFHVGVPYDGNYYDYELVQPYLKTFNGDQYQTAVNFGGTRTVVTGEIVNAGFDGVRAMLDRMNKDINSIPGMMSSIRMMGVTLVIKEKTSNIEVDPPANSRGKITEITKYINDNGAGNVAAPQPKPSLTCPSGEKINLTIDGSTFLQSDGSVMLVNKDGTATVNGTSCALQWQTPEMAYVDDKPAMTDADGNWLDMVTGDILQCVVIGECKPTVPKDDEEVEELDNSLIEYIKNAYEYATGVLKTATDGLKSLATGAKDLTALFGTFFSWLPREMVVLMSSGLALAIGLRLFRK